MESLLRTWPRSPLSIVLALFLLLPSSSSVPSPVQSQESCCREKCSILNPIYSSVWECEAGFCGCKCPGVTCYPGGRATNLTRSNLGLSGKIPRELSKFICLASVNLSHNKFNGSIPEDLFSLKHLKFLDLSWNSLTGTIPPLENSVPDLRPSLSANSTCGDSPASVSKLEILNLSNNNLTGPVPRNTDAPTSLRSLYLSANQLGKGNRGSDLHEFIQSLASCRKLDELALSGNGFTGRIPENMFNLSSLSVLHLSHNEFNGSLPREIGALTQLVTLDVSHNNLSGEIPSSLGNCTKSKFLYLQNNNFSGNIPYNFSKLQSLVLLNLSNNNLSGPIPSFFASFHELHTLDVSFNNLEDPLPAALLCNPNISLLHDGNKRLSSIPCTPNTEPNASPASPRPDGPVSRSRYGSPKVAVALVVAIAVLIFFILLVFLFCKYKCFANERSGRLSKGVSFAKSPLEVTYADLQAATEGFSSNFLIGLGGTGSVYRGFLEQEKKPVAVKVLDREILGDQKSFIEECKNMASIGHTNIVKLLAHCATTDFNGDQFKALVYELVPNGNLETWLHKEAVVSQEMPSKMWNLSLYQRLNIAIDVASALTQLHCLLEKPIVHCNLKPSNILIAEDMTALVVDFGMNRFFRMEKVVAKSTGYVAPEYATGSPISALWDVYSFGILLLEMFTGKRPTDEELNLTENYNLHKYVFQRYPQGIEGIIDPLLISEETGGELTDRTRSCVMSIIHIALVCSKEIPEGRMDMRTALEKLEQAKDSLLNAGGTGVTLHKTLSRAGSSAAMLA